MIAQEHILALWEGFHKPDFVDSEAYTAKELLQNSPHSWDVLIPWQWAEFSGSHWAQLSVSDVLEDCYSLDDTKFKAQTGFCMAGTGQRL
jgi:hypothetical protein